MAFHGLFIGIDRYASPRINWLNCAGRDAMALHALFADTLGSVPTFLTDEKATRPAIEKHFEILSKCNADDIVVVAFSGHGTPTHEIVTYDADPDKLAETSIPLATLAEWFSRIPARHLVCVLDCCFSGGIGSKVFFEEMLPRDLSSSANVLDQISGDGRLVFTASKATQPAWENQKLGHGLLTYYLLESLQGAEEVRQSGKISIYALLDHVTKRVEAAAQKLGKSQNPTLRGSIDGNLTWPIFKPGAVFRAAFPERSRPKAAADPQSLAPFGFPPDLLRVWGSSISGLNQLQLDAINEFEVLDGQHLVVSAPTSSGKTMIGELAALKGALNRKRTLFLLPLKALVNDKHRQFIATYSRFGVRVLRATGDSTDDIPEILRGQYDICLVTYEKFTALALGSPHVLEQAGVIVVDEVQMIADKSRGVNLEFILTLVRMRRLQGVEPQIIALSAVIGDTNGLERWLGARLLRRVERPVPLDEGIVRGDGSFRYLDSENGKEAVIAKFVKPEALRGGSQDWVIPLVRKLVRDGKQVIVFRETRGLARGCALYLAETLGLPAAQTALDSLPTGDSTLVSNALREALSRGVAFHISDLDREERLVIEGEFRKPKSTIRVIVATTTLAMGVNTPAEAVVIVGLTHPFDEPYSVAEYKNIVGRAGRLGYAQRGASYLLALSSIEEEHVWKRYVSGRPEDIISRFLSSGTDPRSLIVRVLVAVRKSGGQGLTADEIIGFLEGSFGAYQKAQATQNWKWDRSILARALGNLEQHKLIARCGDEGYELSKLGWIAGHGGIEVESITRLVELLTPLDPDSINDPTLIAAAQITVELDNVNFPLNKKSTQKEPQTWTTELRRQGVPTDVIYAMRRWSSEEHIGTLRAKKTAACLLWITDKPLGYIEEILTQFGGKFDGAAGPIRSTASRTHDLLPIVARVAEILHPSIDLSQRIEHLFVRLELGVAASAVDIAMQAGDRLSRSDYQSLVRAELSSVKALAGSSDEKILACVGDQKGKLLELRKALENYREKKQREQVKPPILPPYED